MPVHPIKSLGKRIADGIRADLPAEVLAGITEASQLLAAHCKDVAVATCCEAGEYVAPGKADTDAVVRMTRAAQARYVIDSLKQRRVDPVESGKLVRLWPALATIAVSLLEVIASALAVIPVTVAGQPSLPPDPGTDEEAA